MMTENEVRAAVGHFQNLTLDERKHKLGGTWYDYTFARWRINARSPKVWVTMPHRVEIPAKHGLYSCNTFTQNDIMLVGPEPIAEALRKEVLHGNYALVCRAVQERFGWKPGVEATVVASGVSDVLS
jgi:hypothetical protein